MVSDKIFFSLQEEKNSPFLLLYIGTSHGRRKHIIERLNSEYQAMISVKVKMFAIYEYLVNSENYRVLSQYEYSWKELPLRSSRICQKPALTDVM